MIHSLYRKPDGTIEEGLTTEELTAALQDDGGLLWLDLREEAIERCRPILRETFGFHPLAVEDALEEAHVPKVDDWGEYLYLVLHAISFDPEAEDLLDTQELDIFLGSNYLVTYQAKSTPAAARIWEACRRNGRPLQKGAGRLLYSLADELASDYLPAVEDMDAALDRIEDRVFDNPRLVLLEEIITL